MFNKTGNLRADLICGYYKPLVRYCHLTGLNNPSNGIYYKFTPYKPFDAASAHKVCAKVGGAVPSLETELHHLYLMECVETLLSFVSVGQPFSLKWMTWPVSLHY